MENQEKCRYCGSERTVQKGARKTKTMGIRRIRCCKACSRRFTVDIERRDPVLTPEHHEAENLLAGPSG
jgi:hypothetical protein